MTTKGISLTKPGTQYEPLKIEEQHQIINSYGLAFLNAHLRSDAETSPGMAASAGTFNGEYLTANHFGDEVLLNAKPWVTLVQRGTSSAERHINTAWT